MKAPLPANEAGRLQSLKQYELLDTADEIGYNDLVVLAASICQTPMAYISLIDEDRQWFKARIGVGYRESDRSQSFCAHAILKPDEILIVQDTKLDRRFTDNDFVLSKPNVRFYAGVPLVSADGHALGALAVLDRESRGITVDQVELLRALGRQATALFELRRSKFIIRTQAETLIHAESTSSGADKTKQVFLSNISHEFRTPINGIVGLSSLLASTPLADKQLQYVKTIEDCANGLLHVLSDILDFAKNEGGQSESHLSRIDVIGLVDQLAAMMKPMAVAKQIDFVIDVDDYFRQRLMGDELRIKQIHANLIGNALKFTQRGSVEVRVGRVAETPEAAVIRFMVRDTGIGIPRNMQSRIFEEFTQVEQGPERNYGGTGLGLTISRQLAKGMRTEIKVSSELGEGSTFWFDLEMPFDSGFDTLIHQAPEVKKDESRRFRILVVDDNDFHSMILGSLLEKLDCDVEVVESGEAIVGLLGRRVFDLVFLDAHMPDDVALAYAKSIRRMPYPTCNVPIVAMSPSVSNEDEATYVSAGINDIVIKPVSERAVFHTVSKWCSRKETRATA